MHAPVTHPTLQPLLTVSIVFLFISFIYFRLYVFVSFFSPTFAAFNVATRPFRRNARIIFPCAHAIFLFYFCKLISSNEFLNLLLQIGDEIAAAKLM